MPKDVLELTPIRSELLDWFRKNAPSLAPAYEGAVRLLADLAFSGRIHFIAHAGRDICDRLVVVLDPQLEGKRVQYEQVMYKVYKEWFPLTNISEEHRATKDGITIPYKLASRLTPSWNSTGNDESDRRR